MFNDFNGKVMSGMVAENYMKGKLSDILSTKKNKGHWAVAQKIEKKEEKVEIPAEEVPKHPAENIIQKDDKFFVKKVKEKTVF